MNRIAVAKENLVRSIVAEIRRVAREPHPDPDRQHRRWINVEQRVWRAFEKGELDGPQEKMLRQLINEHMSEYQEAT